MHNTGSKSDRDSKYTVADILSSMANGEAVTPTAFSSPNFISGVTTISTPTLTPTTLATLEQSFIDLDKASKMSPNQVTQSGFVPPVVSEFYADNSSNDSVTSNDPEWTPVGSSSPKKPRLSSGRTSMRVPIVIQKAPPNRNKGGRKRAGTDIELPPAEAEKRRVRRERNKAAAAKCRQRRVDAINTLSAETDDLEDVQAELENEIQNLSQQKEQLEFILQAHRPMCKKQRNSVSVIVKTESPRKPVAIPVPVTTQHRPTSLNFVSTETTASKSTLATGVPIVTPSSGIVTFSLDSIVDGSTGLTPLCGPPTTCANMVEKSNSGLMTPTTLISL
ncbi:unnamed protein product [Owenia fusiformis]|uniref:BZIP domain-containing protein n=1 Tax=Owenia fusiformis TaxID=6347 RepID=A0A8S4PLG9_OWEFU|nr:unnamed protein product [Owenia fusiformis]